MSDDKYTQFLSWEFDAYLENYYKQPLVTDAFYGAGRIRRGVLDVSLHLDEDEVRKILDFAIENNMSVAPFGLSFRKGFVVNGEENIPFIIFYIEIIKLAKVIPQLSITESFFGNDLYMFEIGLHRKIYRYMDDDINLEILRKLKKGEWKDLVSEGIWNKIKESGYLEQLDV